MSYSLYWNEKIDAIITALGGTPASVAQSKGGLFIRDITNNRDIWVEVRQTGATIAYTFLDKPGGVAVTPGANLGSPLSTTTETRLTSETLTVSAASVQLPNIPAAATGAQIQVQGADVRVKINGTDPTATSGFIQSDTSFIILETRAEVLACRAIRGGATDATLYIEYIQKA